MQGGLRSEDLDLCFKKVMVFGASLAGGGDDRGRMDDEMMNNWKDIPEELLLRILSLVDDKTVIRASGVCSGWREAICLGLTRLCLSWYSFLALCWTLLSQVIFCFLFVQRVSNIMLLPFCSFVDAWQYRYLEFGDLFVFLISLYIN